MSTEVLLRQAVKGALALGAAGSMAGAGAALAQTAAPATATSSGATKLSNIIVTGSRIPRTSIAQAQPVITINRQEIQNTGFNTTAELLQNLTSAGSSLTTAINNGNNGTETVNLHDLGSQRVLVLVNGQRWIPTLFGSVDLSTIPLSVVQRVEVLLDGASAVYGSEAIAGVINIITNKNYNGAEAHAYYGAYDGHGDGGGWDGKTQQYSFTVGTSGDKSGVLLSAGYYNQNPVWAGQRNISKEPFIGSKSLFGSSGTPGGRFITVTPPGNTVPSFPGCTSYAATPSYPFIGSCDISGGHAAGNPALGGSGFANGTEHAWVGADHYNYAPLNYFLTPSERWYTYSQGHYDLTDNLTFNFTTTYQRRNSTALLAPNPWFLYAAPAGSGNLSANGLPLGVSGSTKYNPFGVDLVPAYYTTQPTFQAWCAKYGSGGGPYGCSSNWQVLSLIGLRPLAAGTRNFNDNLQTFYFNGGFTGYFMLAGNQWNWNANYIYGQTMDTAITTGLANTARMQTALGPVSQCNSLPGCSPLDLFSGGGNLTPAMLKYILFTAKDVTDNVIRDYNASVAGNFWNSWYAGPWGAAAGYEYEENDGFFSPDALISAGNTVGNVAQPTNGRENSNAQFVELNIPFANNAPLAKSLSVDLAERWEQYKWGGVGNVVQGTTVTTAPVTGQAHSAAGRMTIKWQPIQQLLLRGTWSQGFRAPSLSELFSGVGDNFPGLTDPCVPSTPGGPIAPYCNRPHTQPNSQIHSSVGGSATLEPETSTGKSAGFVYSPNWAPGLDFSADYYTIEIEHIIGRLGGAYYLNQCYVAGNSNTCSHLLLNSSGTQVVNILDFVNNGGSKKVSGWDFDLRYKLPTTPVGDFTFALGGNFTQQDVQCNVSGQCVDYAGTAGVLSFAGGSTTGQPMHRFNFAADWNYGPWSATWRTELIGPMWESCSNPGVIFSFALSYIYNNNLCSNPAKDQNHLGTTIYHDVQASYTVSSWNTTFTLGVNNVFDKQPPISLDAFANSSLPVYYRIPGRFFYGRVSVNF